MSSFFGFGGGAKPDAVKKEKVMEDVKTQLAVSNVQELVGNMSRQCFARCITKPSDTLTASDQGCLSRCLDRYLEAFSIVSQTYVNRVSKERESAALQ